MGGADVLTMCSQKGLGRQPTCGIRNSLIRFQPVILTELANSLLVNYEATCELTNICSFTPRVQLYSLVSHRAYRAKGCPLIHCELRLIHFLPVILTELANSFSIFRNSTRRLARRVSLLQLFACQSVRSNRDLPGPRARHPRRFLFFCFQVVPLVVKITTAW